MNRINHNPSFKWPRSMTFTFILLITLSRTFGQDIIIEKAEGRKNQTLIVPVLINNPQNIAGVTMTVTFDTNALDVSIDSGFFGEYADNVDSEKINPFLTLKNGTQLDAPYVVRPIQNQGLAFSGVRLKGVTPLGNPNELMKLTIQFKESAQPGLYMISLSPTRTANITWNPIIGHREQNNLHPVIVSASDLANRVTSGSANLLPPLITDSDGDMIPDSWELKWFKSIDPASKTSNNDKDEFLDIMEYFLGTDPTKAENRVIIQPFIEDNHFKILLPMRLNHNLNVSLQWSDNLSTWSSEGIETTQRDDLPKGDGWATFELKTPISTLNQAKGFFSVEIQ